MKTEESQTINDDGQDEEQQQTTNVDTGSNLYSEQQQRLKTHLYKFVFDDKKFSKCQNFSPMRDDDARWVNFDLF